MNVEIEIHDARFTCCRRRYPWLTMTPEMIDTEDDVLNITETRTAISKSVMPPSFPVDDRVVALTFGLGIPILARWVDNEESCGGQGRSCDPSGVICKFRIRRTVLSGARVQYVARQGSYERLTIVHLASQISPLRSVGRDVSSLAGSRRKMTLRNRSSRLQMTSCPSHYAREGHRSVLNSGGSLERNNQYSHSLQLYHNSPTKPCVWYLCRSPFVAGTAVTTSATWRPPSTFDCSYPRSVRKRPRLSMSR